MIYSRKLAIPLATSDLNGNPNVKLEFGHYLAIRLIGLKLALFSVEIAKNKVTGK
jgi:hypothetical protein